MKINIRTKNSNLDPIAQKWRKKNYYLIPYNMIPCNCIAVHLLIKKRNHNCFLTLICNKYNTINNTINKSIIVTHTIWTMNFYAFIEK